MHRAGAAQSELRIGRVAAARSTPDYPALAVLNTALGGAFVSRINLKLREEKGFTYGARSSFDYRRQAGPFAVQASVQTDATAEAVADVLAEIADIRGSATDHARQSWPGRTPPSRAAIRATSRPPTRSRVRSRSSRSTTCPTTISTGSSPPSGGSPRPTCWTWHAGICPLATCRS